MGEDVPVDVLKVSSEPPAGVRHPLKTKTAHAIDSNNAIFMK